MVAAFLEKIQAIKNIPRKYYEFMKTEDNRTALIIMSICFTLRLSEEY